MALKTIDDTVLSSIADSIRGKNGETTTYKPTEMAAAIDAIEGGGITIDGYWGVQYLCQGQGWSDNFFAKNPSMVINNCTDCSYLFYNNTTITAPSLEIKAASNLQVGKNENPWGPPSIYMFYGCTKLQDISNVKISGTWLRNCGYMFYNCQYLTEVPENWVPEGSFKAGPAYTTTSVGWPQNGGCFYQCYRLTDIHNFYDGAEDCIYSSTISYVPTYYNFYKTYCLRQVLDFPTFTTSNTFSSTSPFNNFLLYCFSLRRFTFREGGTLKRSGTAAYTLNLKYTGYWYTNTASPSSYMTDPLMITDDETYQLYKDEPNAATTLPEYSFYGHDSALETLQSLPTIVNSSTGTVTIMFDGNCGASTDQGAISNLTDEEIAIATDKGWTVSIS